MRRTITCPCGHQMKALDDAMLFTVVRRHVDDRHPELNYSDQMVRDMISEDATNIGP